MLSISMAPKDTGSMFFSFLICLDAVPEETREWKPDTAPQAMVTNRIGNRYWPSTLNPCESFQVTGRVGYKYTDDRSHDHKDQQIAVQVISRLEQCAYRSDTGNQDIQEK